MCGAPNTFGVLMLTKTGKVTRNRRSARRFYVRVVTEDGRVFRGTKDHGGEWRAAEKAASLLTNEGLPSTWDEDVLESHYIRVQ